VVGDPRGVQKYIEERRRVLTQQTGRRWGIRETSIACGGPVVGAMMGRKITTGAE